MLIALALLALARSSWSAPSRGAGAAPPSVPERLGLRDCLALAVEHNVDLQQASTRVENAHSRLLATAQLGRLTLESGVTSTTTTRGANSVMNTVGSSYSREMPSGMSLTFGSTFPWLDSRDQGGEAGVELALPLMRGRGKVSDKRVALDRTALALEQERLQYFMARQRLLEQVNRAYYEALLSRERVSVQRSAVEISQKATDDAQKRLDAGLITEIDVTRAKIQLASSREALINQEAAYRDSLDRLVLLLGLPVGSAPELTEAVPGAVPVTSPPGPLPETTPSATSGQPPQPPNNGGSLGAPGRSSPHYWGAGGAVSGSSPESADAPGTKRESSESAPTADPPTTPGPQPPIPEPDLDAAIREALANRPELRTRELEERQAVLDQLVARDQKKPRADLRANLSALGLSFLTGGGLGRVLTSVLGLRLSAPVNHVALREDEATAERNLAQLRRTREQDRQEIVEEVRSLFRARQTAQSNIALLTENLKVAQQSLHLAQRLIEEGLADNRNFLDAQSSLTNTQSSLVAAHIDDYLTQVSLRRAMGQDLVRHFGLPAGSADEVRR